MDAISNYARRILIPLGLASFVLAAAPAILDIGLFCYFYPVIPRRPGNPDDPLVALVGFINRVIGPTEVYTKSGTYEIKAPRPRNLTSVWQQQKLCEYYVQEYEKHHNTYRGALLYGPMIKKSCGISLDDILNNIRAAGGTNN